MAEPTSPISHGSGAIGNPALDALAALALRVQRLEDENKSLRSTAAAAPSSSSSSSQPPPSQSESQSGPDPSDEALLTLLLQRLSSQDLVDAVATFAVPVKSWDDRSLAIALMEAGVASRALEQVAASLVASPAGVDTTAELPPVSLGARGGRESGHTPTVSPALLSIQLG